MNCKAKFWSAVIAVPLLVGITGCADRNKDDIPDDTATKKEITKTLDKVETKATKTLTKASDEAETLATNGTVTTKVKAAFIDDPDLKASRINVDTDSTRKTVTINGSVQTAAQKQRATNLARKQVPSGFKIVNNLKVPPAKAKH